MYLPGIEQASRVIQARGGRAQIMIVDDSSSMRKHMQRVKVAVRVISYFAKTTNHDGIEVYSASGITRKPGVYKTSSQTETAIDKMETVQGKCDMGACIDHILDKILVDGKRVKPTNVYIYTDGVWEPGTNVERPIHRAINHLTMHDEPLNTLVFQFVQFGYDVEGRARLLSLDDSCRKQTGHGIQ
ncbi:hypothetical protein NW766_000922 [Fusarium irregulare]|uniref:VWFA domain-containing protein n=1 Tax=Fusarium irregulare TaxID=2494466 RepID=A0A9W8UG74_9HYPO|nr:hypothetical protein NW766_000922 [Fusarium irregulare]